MGFKLRLFVVLTAFLGTQSAQAATCGNTSSGFEAWKVEFAGEAKRAGVKKRGLQALAQAQYANRTIAADRNQKSFKYTLDKFMQVRGANTIVAQGRKRKARNPAFYAALEKQYGVPAGILIPYMGWKPPLAASWVTAPLSRPSVRWPMIAVAPISLYHTRSAP